jgi:hypothetical protein
MGEQQADMAKEFQELFKKTAEANKLFLSEGAKFVSQLATGKLKGEKLASLNNTVLTDAFSAYVRLGIQYTSDLVDLGVTLTKRMKEQLAADAPAGNEEAKETNKPAFILKAAGHPGSTATTEFLLDNDKKETVVCNLRQTLYTLQDDPNVKVLFETTFSPQSFHLVPGQPQRVEITVTIPVSAKEGIYVSHTQVEGFEHIFFSLYLQVASEKSINTPS